MDVTLTSALQTKSKSTFPIRCMEGGLLTATSLITCRSCVCKYRETSFCIVLLIIVTNRVESLFVVILGYLDISKNKYNSAIPIQIGQLPSLENFYAVDAGITGDLSFMEPMTQISK